VFDHFGDPALLIGDVDLQLAPGRRVVAAVAAVSNDAGEARANLRLDLRDDGLERVAVVRISGQRLHLGDELPALRFGLRRRLHKWSPAAGALMSINAQG
jgi:hypothetical protein